MATTHINLAVAEVVTDLRREAAISQMSLADLAGIPKTTMQRRLGDGDFTVTELGSVALVLGVTPAFILHRAADILASVA